MVAAADGFAFGSRVRRLRRLCAFYGGGRPRVNWLTEKRFPSFTRSLYECFIKCGNNIMRGTYYVPTYVSLCSDRHTEQRVQLMWLFFHFFFPSVDESIDRLMSGIRAIFAGIPNRIKYDYTMPTSLSPIILYCSRRKRSCDLEMYSELLPCIIS